MLPLVVALLVTAEEPSAPESVDSDQAGLLAVTLGASAAGVGLALGASLDNHGLGGRACAIAAGTLGGGFLVAGLAALIIHAITRSKDDNLFEDTVSFAATVGYSLIAGLVGLAGGAIASLFTSSGEGTPRLATGVAGGSAIVIASIGFLIYAW